MARTVKAAKRPEAPRQPRATAGDRAIGAKVRLRRIEMGMSQTDLAQKIGVTYQQIQKYESGLNRIGGSRLGAIASALGVPATYFFEPMPEAPEVEGGLASLLHERGAIALLQAYAGIKDQRQRHSLIELARAMAGEDPLQ